MRQKLQNKKRKKCPTLRNPFFLYFVSAANPSKDLANQDITKGHRTSEKKKPLFFTNLFNIDPVYTSTSTCRKKHQQVGEPTETPPHLADYIQFALSQPTEKPAETGRNHTQASISPYPPSGGSKSPYPARQA